MESLKLKRLVEKMKEQELDAVLVYNELNQRYLSEFAFTDGLLLITKKSAYLLTDFRYYEMALKGACRDFIISDVHSSDVRTTTVPKVFEEEGCKRVGFEGSFLSYERYLSLCERYPSVEFVNIGSMIEELRMIKTAQEIEYMQKAQDMTDKAFSHILNVLNPDMTEIDVAVELEYSMRKSGAESFAFETIAVSGDASALPHGTPRNEKLKRGFLTMDFGAKYNGYCSDMTRTVVIGKADEDMKKLYNTVLTAQMSALEMLKAGVTGAAADKVARDIINKDYDGCFGHSLGHSVGLFIHESPSLSSRATETRLSEGHVVTVEPGIYVFGKYGCRIEDMVCIKENGIYNFTHSPKELIEI